MLPLQRTTHRLAPVLSLTAGVLLGAGIGLPMAHWVAGLITRAPLVVAPTGAAAQPSPTARPGPPSSSSAATALPTPSPAQLACPPLATGQQPLDQLRPPPPGYRADAALDWVGCGAQTVPAMDGFSITGPWLVALAYTCPPGTSAASGGATLTVSDTDVLTELGPEAIVLGRSDSADVTGGGPGGSQLVAGIYHVSVAAPSACLWHLEVYRG